MNSSITEFKEQIKHIETHLNVLEKYEQIIKKLSDEDADFIKSNSTQEKQFSYRSNIISLYGAFEHFIENIIIEYIGSIQKLISSFDEWAPAITGNYFDLWKKLHGKLKYPKYSFISENEMVENIHKIVINHEKTLIPQCFLQNGGNYRANEICDMFKRVGINNINDFVIKYEPFQSYLSEQFPEIQNVENGRRTELYFQDLEDLVNRRNEIAHGSSDDNTIDGNSFIEKIQFVKSYAEAINNYLTDKVYERQWGNNKPDAIKITNVFTKAGNIALLDINDIRKDSKKIMSSSKILVNYKENECSRFFITKIKEIRVDLTSGEKDKTVDEIVVDSNVEQISIEVSEKVKPNQKIKIL